jgi:hypothetical protein
VGDGRDHEADDCLAIVGAIIAQHQAELPDRVTLSFIPIDASANDRVRERRPSEVGSQP